MLQRKREALVLLARDLEVCMRERDQLRAMVKKFAGSCACAAAPAHLPSPSSEGTVASVACAASAAAALSEQSPEDIAWQLRKQKALMSQLANEKKALLSEVKELQNRLGEAHEDIGLLRETVARQKFSSINSTSSYSSETFESTDKLEDLVNQLEVAKTRIESLEQELFTYKEESAQVKNEKQFYLKQSERLNTELNYLLTGDNDNAILDIDALRLENKHLKQQLTQVQSEKQMLKDHYLKAKQSILKPNPKKTDRSVFKSVSDKTSSGGERYLSTKQVQQYLQQQAGSGSFPVTSKTVDELHMLSLALTETVEEKNVALTHQKNTNKALGKRVAELENKLKNMKTLHGGYSSHNPNSISPPIPLNGQPPVSSPAKISVNSSPVKSLDNHLQSSTTCSNTLEGLEFEDIFSSYQSNDNEVKSSRPSEFLQKDNFYEQLLSNFGSSSISEAVGPPSEGVPTSLEAESSAGAGLFNYFSSE